MDPAGNELHARPLWNHVNILKIVGGGNVLFKCKYCAGEYNGSYSRVEAHLLKLSKCGIRVCPHVTAAILEQLQNEIAEAQGEQN
ncbi:hypothetical protein ACP70R_013728 [Stipagrostis hirtigluma subsp. patula]